MGDVLCYANVPGYQEEYHAFIYTNLSVGIRRDGSREDNFGPYNSLKKAMGFIEQYIIKDLEKLGPERGEFGTSSGWLENYLAEEE